MEISHSQPLGDHPDDREPISGPLGAVEAILRRPRRVMYQLRQPDAGRLILEMILVTVVCALLYGVVVGTFLHGHTTLGRARENRRRPIGISADLSPQSLHLYLPEWIARKTRRNQRAYGGAAYAYDALAHRFRASGMALFPID